MTESSYTVAGMTCDHCAGAVRTELARIDGVHDVHVDIPTGTVTITSDRPLPTDEIHTAITEAGYQPVG